jgi:shikimate dehydrogenase
VTTSLFPARTFALLGNPVAHSLSPIFQNAAFCAAGIQATYIALQCEADEVAGHIHELTRSGGGGNVTVPHKTIAAASIEIATEELTLTGACNTFWMENGRICGDNTDVAGFKAALTALAGDVNDARVLLLGAGGAARAAVLGLRQLGAAPVAVWNRSPTRFDELRTHAAPLGLPLRPYDRRERFDIIINATSIGLHGQSAPPISAADAGARYALDLVYRVGGTPWVTAAVAGGVNAADGLEMLLHQGARAFERWCRTPAPLDVMRTALTEAAARTA